MGKKVSTCDCRPINEELVSAIQKDMMPEEIYENTAAFFKMAGDPTRCKILSVLAMSELCVGDLANVLSMTKSSISHQLGRMKEGGVVKSRKEGKEVYYSLDDEHVSEIFLLTVEHMKHLHGLE